MGPSPSRMGFLGPVPRPTGGLRCLGHIGRPATGRRRRSITEVILEALNYNKNFLSEQWFVSYLMNSNENDVQNSDNTQKSKLIDQRESQFKNISQLILVIIGFSGLIISIYYGIQQHKIDICFIFIILPVIILAIILFPTTRSLIFKNKQKWIEYPLIFCLLLTILFSSWGLYSSINLDPNGKIWPIEMDKITYNSITDNCEIPVTGMLSNTQDNKGFRIYLCNDLDDDKGFPQRKISPESDSSWKTKVYVKKPINESEIYFIRLISYNLSEDSSIENHLNEADRTNNYNLIKFPSTIKKIAFSDITITSNNCIN